MPTRIIAISHAWGAGGESIGLAVADRLGFRYVNDEVITMAADKHGLEAALVADAEQRKGLVHRLLEDFGGIPVVDSVRKGVLMSDTSALARRRDVRTFIVDAIREIADAGDVVIVAHAASIPLAGRADLLRVLVTASEKTRTEALANGTRGDKAAATKFMKDSDAARADYFRRFYQIKHELPTHYDIVLNTDALELEEAVDIIVAAARRHARDARDRSRPDEPAVAKGQRRGVTVAGNESSRRRHRRGARVSAKKSARRSRTRRSR